MADKTAALITLGCRLNHADTALLTRRLEQSGYTVVNPDCSHLDLIIINSCAVTAEAVRKSRQIIRRFKAKHPEAQIMATGCAAALDSEKLKLDGAHQVFSNREKKFLPEIIRSVPFVPETDPDADFRENSLSSFPFRSRAFIKIQEGCNNFCTYCIVPYMRGRERSRMADEVLADCQKAVADGFPEIILTGVNTCAYSDGKYDLGALIREIASIPGDFRIRLSSTEPHPNNLSLLEIMADTPRVCRFLHLSLQHGCDRVLTRMNRHYTAEGFLDTLKKIRSAMPDAAITTDIITGFPGETEEEFSLTLENTKKAFFSKLHVFPYSEREGTVAAKMEQLPANIRSDRAKILIAEGKALSREFAESYVGKTVNVLFEEGKDGVFEGYTENYLRVAAISQKDISGEILPVTIKKISGDTLLTGVIDNL